MRNSACSAVKGVVGAVVDATGRGAVGGGGGALLALSRASILASMVAFCSLISVRSCSNAVVGKGASVMGGKWESHAGRRGGVGAVGALWAIADQLTCDGYLKLVDCGPGSGRVWLLGIVGMSLFGQSFPAVA